MLGSGWFSGAVVADGSVGVPGSDDSVGTEGDASSGCDVADTAGSGSAVVSVALFVAMKTMTVATTTRRMMLETIPIRFLLFMVLPFGVATVGCGAGERGV